MTRPITDIPLIVHVIHRFDIGGLENGVVNLINQIPKDRYLYAVVCMRGYSDFNWAFAIRRYSEIACCGFFGENMAAEGKYFAR